MIYFFNRGTALMKAFLAVPILVSGCTSFLAPVASHARPRVGVADRPQAEERLSFQAQEPYRPSVHLNADVAMVYGIDGTLPMSREVTPLRCFK